MSFLVQKCKIFSGYIYEVFFQLAIHMSFFWVFIDFWLNFWFLMELHWVWAKFMVLQWNSIEFGPILSIFGQFWTVFGVLSIFIVFYRKRTGSYPCFAIFITFLDGFWSSVEICSLKLMVFWKINKFWKSRYYIYMFLEQKKEVRIYNDFWSFLEKMKFARQFKWTFIFNGSCIWVFLGF